MSFLKTIRLQLFVIAKIIRKNQRFFYLEKCEPLHVGQLDLTQVNSLPINMPSVHGCSIVISSPKGAWKWKFSASLGNYKRQTREPINQQNDQNKQPTSWPSDKSSNQRTWGKLHYKCQLGIFGALFIQHNLISNLKKRQNKGGVTWIFCMPYCPSKKNEIQGVPLS